MLRLNGREICYSSRSVWLRGHHVKGSRNSNYKGIDLWVKENQGKHFCQCRACLEKGSCAETAIKIENRHHYANGRNRKTQIPKYLPYHWHRGNARRVYQKAFGQQVSAGLKRYFQQEPVAAKQRRIERSRKSVVEDWQNWHRRFHRRPSVPEFVMAQLLPPTIRYVGDGKLWCKMPNGKRRNPDFHVVGTNKVIELFGEWYHRHDDPKKFVAEYRKAGMRCLVIWEREVMEKPTRSIPGHKAHEAVQRCMAFEESK